MAAAMKQNCEVMRWCIEGGCDIEAQDKVRLAFDAVSGLLHLFKSQELPME